MKIAFLATAFLAVLALAAPPLAQAADAQKAAPAKPLAHVEQSIKSLHERLKITEAEEPQWAAVAQAMRDSAQKVGSLAAERRQKAQSMNAVDDLRAYQAIAQAHAEGVAKLADAFQALYGAMSPEQQKNADAVFARTKRRAPAKKPN